MKIKEQLEQCSEIRESLKVGLTQLVLGNVTWVGPRTVANISGMPKKHIKLGLIEGNATRGAYVIVNYIDENLVSCTPAPKIADWSWPAVAAFDGLEDFLRRNVVIATPVNVHTMGDAWARKETGELR